MVDFYCEVESSPVAEIIWLFKDKVYYLEDTPQLLNISIESADEFGEYKCQASNNIGTSVKIFKLEKRRKI